jgi:hypothetical protein
MDATAEVSLAPGWYPDPGNDLLVRWWDGRAWTDDRRGWIPGFRSGGRWFDPTTLEGRLNLLAQAHLAPVAVFMFLAYLAPLALGPGPFLVRDVAIAAVFTGLTALVFWRGGAVQRAAHRRFYTGRPTPPRPAAPPR